MSGGGGLPPLNLSAGPSTADGTAAAQLENKNKLVFKSGISPIATAMIAAAVGAAGWFIAKQS